MRRLPTRTPSFGKGSPVRQRPFLDLRGMAYLSLENSTRSAISIRTTLELLGVGRDLAKSPSGASTNFQYLGSNIHHNSKKHGGAVTTDEEIREGRNG